MDFNKISKKIVSIIKKVEKRTINRISNGRLETEPDISSSFITIIEEEFENYIDIDEDVYLVTRIIRGIGHGAPESRYGPDICVILTIKLNNKLILSKGFFMQGKMEGNPIETKKIGNKVLFKIKRNNAFTGDGKLKDQIEKMLSVTHASYIIVYSKMGFFVGPALEILKEVGINDIEVITIAKFFELFFQCIIGDFYLIDYHDDFFEYMINELKRDKDIQSNLKIKWAKNVIWFDVIQKQ